MQDIRSLIKTEMKCLLRHTQSSFFSLKKNEMETGIVNVLKSASVHTLSEKLVYKKNGIHADKLTSGV